MESITLALAVCAILAILFKKISLPPVPLYILAGLLIGSTGLLPLQDMALPQFFGHLGLIFLLLYSGLEFRPGRFLSQGSSFAVSGLMDMNINMGIGFFGALLLGFSPVESFVVAAAFFDTSSALAITTLIENRNLVSEESETIIWLLIFEDLVMVLLIFLVSSELQSPLFILLKLAALVAFIFSLTRLLRGRLVNLVGRADEIPLLLVFALALSAMALATYLGIPEAALVIILGSALSATNPQALKKIVTPFKDVFLAVFFFFFGFSIHWGGDVAIFPVIAFTLLALSSKTLSGLVIGRALHGSSLAGIEIGMNTLARGEFAIAIAAVFGSPQVSTAIASKVIVTSVIGAVAARHSRTIEGYLWKIGLLAERPPIRLPVPPVPPAAAAPPGGTLR